MSKGEGRIRAVVLCEDSRTERFVRRTLEGLGIHGLRYATAPKGQGSAEAWVLANYPKEVRVLRAKKARLDDELVKSGMSRRASAERIATPVPTWAIENWLLALLGHDVDEAQGPERGREWKHVFERSYLGNERTAIQTAATAFVERQDVSRSLSSLVDGRSEFDRLDGG